MELLKFFITIFVVFGINTTHGLYYERNDFSDQDYRYSGGSYSETQYNEPRCSSTTKYPSRDSFKHVLSFVEKHVDPKKIDTALDTMGRTPFHAACEKGSLISVEKLLEWGADKNVCDRRGRTPLHYAAMNGHFKCVQKLIDANVSINIEDRLGGTPAQYASNNGHDRVLDLLKENGGIVGKSRKRDIKLNINVIRSLISSGDDLNFIDKLGTTPLCYIAGLKYNFTVSYVTEFSGMDEEDLILILIENGAFVNAGDRFGLTPLHWASWRKSKKNIRLLLENGAQVNVQDAHGRMPLHCAAVSSVCTTSFAIGQLLEHGALLNAQDADGRTPLHLAAMKNHKNFELLRDAGARLDVIDKNGRTPLDLFNEKKNYSKGWI